MSSEKPHGGARKMSHSRKGTMTAAVSTRVVRLERAAVVTA
jgi:hypothetical protein